MGERSIESITAALETIQEHFMNLIIPATKTLMLETLSQTTKIGIQPHFVFHKWKKIGTQVSLHEMVENEDPVQRAIDRRGENQNEASWNSIVRLAFRSTRTMTELMGREKMISISALIWCQLACSSGGATLGSICETGG